MRSDGATNETKVGREGMRETLWKLKYPNERRRNVIWISMEDDDDEHQSEELQVKCWKWGNAECWIENVTGGDGSDIDNQNTLHQQDGKS